MDQQIQHIVLIDRSAEDRARVRDALLSGASRTYRFREAESTDEGWPMCQPDVDWPVDCIVVDIDAPTLSGLDLLTRLHDEGAFPCVPVVVLMQNGDPAHAHDAMRFGAQDCVEKDAITTSLMSRLIDNAVHRHAVSRQLLAKQREAEAASRAKSLLIGNISHEIRTPMTAVLGLSELLLDGETNEDRRQLLGMIRDNGQYLVKIVNGLLDLSKIEAGMLEIKPEPISLTGFLADVMRLVGVRAGENQTTLVTEYGPGVPETIAADPLRLRQILLNLVSNAVKFAPGGEVRLTVAVERHSDARTVVFSVRDNGCGIEPHNLQAIFQPFFQSDSDGSRRVGGTGLGLSISRQLAQAMDGTLEVESSVGEGSCFTLRVPLQEAAATGTASTSVQPDVQGNGGRLLEGYHVVVAEDQRATQLLLTRLIEGAGGVVTSVCDGRSLVQLLAQHPERFDAVVTDVQMPALGGLEAAAEIRRRGCQVPILVLTAEAQAETRQAAARAGCDALVTKPIDRHEFIGKLLDACRQATRRCGEAAVE